MYGDDMTVRTPKVCVQPMLNQSKQRCFLPNSVDKTAGVLIIDSIKRLSFEGTWIEKKATLSRNCRTQNRGRGNVIAIYELQGHVADAAVY